MGETMKERNEKRDARIKRKGGIRTSLVLKKQSLKDLRLIATHTGIKSRAEIIELVIAEYAHLLRVRIQYAKSMRDTG